MFLPIKYGLFATTSVVVSTTLLLVSLREKTLLYKFFTNKNVVGIGLLSYSLYLWHWGVLSISRLTIGVHWWSVPLQIALLIALALLSYKFIETPFRTISLKNNSEIFAIWFLAISSSLAFLYGFNKISYRLFLGKKLSNSNDISQILGWDKKKCAEGFSGGFISQPNKKSMDFDNCWINFEDKNGITKNVKEKINVYSYGNSYNIQLIPVFKRLLNENKNKYQYKINVVSCVGIPSARITRFAQKNNPCISTFQNYINWSLNNSQKRSILLINSSMIFFSGKDILFDLSKDRIVQTNYAKQIFAEEINSIGSKAKLKNVDFYITSGVPFLLTNPVTCGNWFNQLNSKPCNTLDPNSKNFQLTPYEDILKLTSKDVSGINIYKKLEETLSSKKDLDIYFSSIDHISAEGAYLLLPLFVEKFNN